MSPYNKKYCKPPVICILRLPIVYLVTHRSRRYYINHSRHTHTRLRGRPNFGLIGIPRSIFYTDDDNQSPLGALFVDMPTHGHHRGNFAAFATATISVTHGYGTPAYILVRPNAAADLTTPTCRLLYELDYTRTIFLHHSDGKVFLTIAGCFQALLIS